MTITHYPTLERGLHIEGEIIEMQGINLDLLPNQLIAVARSAVNLGETLELPDYRALRLRDVSLDGKSAFFEVTMDHNFTNQSVVFNGLFSPLDPPRTEYTPD